MDNTLAFALVSCIAGLIILFFIIRNATRASHQVDLLQAQVNLMKAEIALLKQMALKQGIDEKDINWALEQYISTKYMR